MKLNCGKTPETKEREREERIEQRAYELGQWRWKFAWFPIRMDDNDCRWLEWYQERFPYAYVRLSDRYEISGLHTIEVRPIEEAQTTGESE